MNISCSKIQIQDLVPSVVEELFHSKDNSVPKFQSTIDAERNRYCFEEGFTQTLSQFELDLQFNVYLLKKFVLTYQYGFSDIFTFNCCFGANWKKTGFHLQILLKRVYNRP